MAIPFLFLLCYAMLWPFRKQSRHKLLKTIMIGNKN
jgi:hypothetical protein